MSERQSDSLRLLVVDDARDYAAMVVEFVRSSGAWPGARCQIAASYEQALRELESEAFDVALFDYWLGPRDGVTLLREIRQRGIDTPVIVLTGRGAEEVAVEAMKAGAADYLSKATLTVESLERAIRYALTLDAEARQLRQAEAALRENEARFRALVENSSDALLLVDSTGRVTYMPESTERHLGYAPQQLTGRQLLDFVHQDDKARAQSSMKRVVQNPGVPITESVRFQHADGSWRVMEGVAVNRLDEPAVRAIVMNARDITERRKLEEQFRASQKMEAIGQLAGGVAHDFNNLLTAILGYCNLILEIETLELTVRRDLEEIRSAGERAASLTRQLLAFSRRQMLQPQTVNPNDLVRQLEKLLRRLIREDIELVTALTPDLPPIRVDPASLEQVLVNLAVNARDAMPNGGRLTIETALVELGDEYADTHVSVVPGRYVMLAVSDSGHGMDAATRARVFEPFFTTKAQGRGSGLGLATVYGIVKQNGGYIWVYSEPSHGTSFKVYLPPADPRTVAARSEAAATLPPKRGSETILLVEDEDAVRALAREVLRRNGYTVLEARHGLDAMRVAESHPGTIHLLVTDVVMPHMSGRDLAERLGQLRRDTRVLFMSGYTDHAVVHRDLTPGTEFLQKPFTPDVFARAVRHVLDSASDRQLG